MMRMPGASAVTSGGGTRRRTSEANGGGSSASSCSSVSGGHSGSSTGANASVNGTKEESSCSKEHTGQQGASSGAGSPAVMKMKAEVFEKDRDNFLTTFEKPTQIYRFLRARMAESPIFLQRNLSYMKARMSRSHKSRLGFQIDQMLERKTQQKLEDKRRSFNSVVPRQGLTAFHNKQGPVNYYNVIIMGLTDGQLWLPDTKARLDICIAKICLKKRKDGLGPVTKVFEKCVDVKIYSPPFPKSSQEINIPLPSRCPVISIPAEMCALGTNGHTVRSYKLVIRVTVPQTCLIPKQSRTEQTNHLNNRNHNSTSDSSDEPKAKRRRSAPATKDRENFIYDGDSKNGNGSGIVGDGSDDLVIYSGSISLYENDIPGDKIREADFDMTLKRATKGAGHKISFQRIRRETSWEAFDEKHAKVMEQARAVGKCAKVCLAFRTSTDKPSQFVEPPPPLLSAAIKEEGASNDSTSTSLARLEMRKSVRVIYHFLFGTNSQQQTESRDDLRCPWCSLNCLQLYSLLKHLKLCHPRFHFSFLSIANGAKIEVTINDSYDGSYSGSAFDLVCQPPGEAFARNGPTKRTEVFSILVCRPKSSKYQSLQEFFDCDEKDVDQRRTYITGHNRLYHHTSTCLPIHPREIDVDSEGEPDPEWLRVKTTMMIDEFTDVNEGEKELMKLWNLHVMKYNYVGDCQIPLSCKRFVELHGKELIQKNLYRNFCLHLTNLFDFGLLTPQGVHNTIQLLHSQMKESNTPPTMMRENWRTSQGNNKGGVNGTRNSQSPSKSFSSISSTTIQAVLQPPPNTNAKTGSLSTTITATSTATSATTNVGGLTSSPANQNTANNNTSYNSVMQPSHTITLKNSKKIELKMTKSSTPPGTVVGTRHSSSGNSNNY